MTTFYARVETADGETLVVQESGWTSLAGHLFTAVIRSESKEHIEALSWKAVLPGSVVAEAVREYAARLVGSAPAAGTPAANNRQFFLQLAQAKFDDDYVVIVDKY